MPKLKSHKGLLKRIKVTALGKVKFKSAKSGHLRSHKTGDQMRKIRKMKTAKAGDLPRLEKMLHRHLKPAGWQPPRPAAAAAAPTAETAKA
ncbi:MAG: bL35 family ribosomal protein [Phycisphaeraceae bacterium]